MQTVAGVVSDNGIPTMSATQNLSVAVNLPIQPMLTAVGFTNQQFALNIAGDAGPDYPIQAPTNLADWTPLFVTNPPALPLLWADRDITKLPMQFYRVFLGP